jgi:hypothetical protein
MHEESVEIYSDATNSAVMRHPKRKFPGTLIQGDSLYYLCCLADDSCSAAKEAGAFEAFEHANELRNILWDHLNRYSTVLEEHKIDLPFNRV